MIYLHGHANIGYGAAHNLVLHGSGADYHLVLNPDVEVATDAIPNAVRWINAHPEVGAIAPLVATRRLARIPVQAEARDPRPGCADSRRASCAAVPPPARALRDARRHRSDPEREIIDIAAMSGACMLVRRKAIDQTGGFDPSSSCTSRTSTGRAAEPGHATAYVPAVESGITAAAPRARVRHIGWFMRSGVALLPQARLEVV